MADNLTIDLRGLRGVREALDPRLVLREIGPAIETAAKQAQRTAKGQVPRDTGALGRAIALETKPLEARVFVQRDLIYARVMEEGRRAGAPMPPPQKLAGWARRHGFTGSLFVLARAISRRGIRGRFYMRQGKQAAGRTLVVEVQKAARRIEAKWNRAGGGVVM